MTPAGPDDPGPASVSWDEAREVVALMLALTAGLMVVAPILYRLIDGQFDRAALRSALTGAGPTAGALVLGAALVVATTPAVDVPPRLRALVVQVASVVLAVAVLAALEILFDDAAGGVRRFFTRFPTILRFPAPGALLAGTAVWLARRVAPFPAG